MKKISIKREYYPSGTATAIGPNYKKVIEPTVVDPKYPFHWLTSLPIQEWVEDFITEVPLTIQHYHAFTRFVISKDNIDTLCDDYVDGSDPWVLNGEVCHALVSRRGYSFNGTSFYKDLPNTTITLGK